MEACRITKISDHRASSEGVCGNRAIWMLYWMQPHVCIPIRQGSRAIKINWITKANARTGRCRGRLAILHFCHMQSLLLANKCTKNRCYENNFNLIWLLSTSLQVLSHTKQQTATSSHILTESILEFFLVCFSPSPLFSIFWLQALTFMNAELPQSNSRWCIKLRGEEEVGAGRVKAGPGVVWERLATHPLRLPWWCSCLFRNAELFSQSRFWALLF